MFSRTGKKVALFLAMIMALTPLTAYADELEGVMDEDIVTVDETENDDLISEDETVYETSDYETYAEEENTLDPDQIIVFSKSAANTVLVVNNGTQNGIAAPTAPAATGTGTTSWTGSKVYFGKHNGSPVLYRVLDPNCNDYKDQYASDTTRTMLLDCNSILFPATFSGSLGGDSNEWNANNVSNHIRDRLNGTSFLENTEYFSDVEKGAIISSNISKGSTDRAFLQFGKKPALSGNKIFLLDYDDIIKNNYGYGEAINGDVHTVICGAKCKSDGSSSSYWLRTASGPASTSDPYEKKVGIIQGDGVIAASQTTASNGVSPALNVRLSSVLFATNVASDANGKTYKLTLLDSSVGASIDTDNITRIGNTVTVPYSNVSGNCNSLKVLITTEKEYNESGTVIQMYSSFVNDPGNKGSGTFTLPSDFDTWNKKYVYIIPEIDAGATNTGTTDYAGNPLKITVPPAQTSIAGAEVTADAQKYTGEALEALNPKVVLDGYELEEGTDYEVLQTGYTDNIDVGTATFTVRGKGDYTGVATGQFTINKGDQKIKIPQGSYTKKVGDAAFDLDAEIEVGDGTLSYKSGDEKVVKVSASGKVTIVGNGKTTITVTASETDNYEEATKTVNITVNAIEKKTQTITTSASSYTKKVGDAAFNLGAKTNGDGKLSYTSEKPSVASVDGNGRVTIKAAGTTNITITAEETTNYKGAEKIVSITVRPGTTPAPTKKDISKAKVTDIKDKRYTGKKLGVTCTVTMDGKKLVRGKDYKIVFDKNTDRINVGNVKFKVKGMGEYTNSLTKSFRIKRALNTLSVTPKKNKLNVKFQRLQSRDRSIGAKDAFNIKSKNGKVSFEKRKGNAKITVAKNGTVKIKKGLRKGTFEVKVRVKADGDKNHKVGYKNVVLTIVVK